MSGCWGGENDEKDEFGEERPWWCAVVRVRGGSHSLQYITAMHFTISSESLLGVSFRTWSSGPAAPRYSARLITLVLAFWAYWRTKQTNKLSTFKHYHHLLLRKHIRWGQTYDQKFEKVGTSIIDNGWDWHARTDFPRESSVGGEILAANADAEEHWDSDEWQRWTLASTLLFFLAMMTSLSSITTVRAREPAALLIMGVASIGTLGSEGGVCTLSSLMELELVGDTASEINAFLYKERRYCSK